MNIGRLKKVRAFIAAAKPEAINMREFMEAGDGKKLENIAKEASYATAAQCGSLGCISGWTCIALAGENEVKLTARQFERKLEKEACNLDTYYNDNGYGGFFHRAQKQLGLSFEDAEKLFLGKNGGWATFEKEDDDEYDYSVQSRIIELSGETGKRAILKQLDFMIAKGKV